MEIKAYAKINLTLEILGRREDGYHLLRSVMHTVSLHDTLAVRPWDGAEATGALPADNSVLRAIEAFRAATGLGARVKVEKRIPEEAGLGGASADAAAALRAMNAIYGYPVSEAALLTMGEAIGADVPFCMTGGCCLAEGIGERLTALPRLDLPLLIVKPPVGISTARLFSLMSPPYAAVDTAAAVAAVKRGEAPEPANALQPAAEALAPRIAILAARLIDAGAVSAAMTGSGSAVFGIFPSRASAAAARLLFDDCPLAAVAHTV